MKRSLFIADIISAMLLLLFVYAALSKLADHQSFRLVLARSPYLKQSAPVIAWLLPFTEIAISVLLLRPLTRPWGLCASAFLLTCFTIYLGVIELFSPDLPCSCGGVLRSLSWPQHIFFNLFFILLSAGGILLYNKHKEAMKQTPP